MISVGVERMLLLYVATGLRVARTSIDTALRDEGMDDAAIEQAVEAAQLRWRHLVVGSYAVTGMLLLLIRRLLDANATVGLFFSLGGMLAVAFAATAGTRLYIRGKHAPSKGGGS